MSLLAAQDVDDQAREDDDVDKNVAEVSQVRLMARRFKNSKLSLAATILLAIFYVIMLFSDFFAVNNAQYINANSIYLPPSKITFTQGKLQMCPVKQEINSETLSVEYKQDCSTPVPIHWFGHGYKYKLLWLIPTDRHLMAVDKPNNLYLWGGDDQGRDVFSRSIIGSKVSLTIGVISVIASTFLASILGMISGYFAGAVDNVIQRISEVIMSIPTLPLWLVLAAVLPKNMSVTSRYLAISLILTLTVWPGLARQVRAKVFAFSRSDYVNAARVAGSGTGRIMMTHLLPNTASHLIVVACLSVPGAIAAETSLSFLGVGMMDPAVSWGVLLQTAQKTSVVITYPWMLIPAALVIIAVTCFQLLGDGLRDAIDPYS